MIRTRPSDGFTLVEVLVALVIFAIAATALVSSVSNATAQLGRLEERQFAALVAHNRMSGFYLNGIPPERLGRDKNGGREFEWRVATYTTDTPQIIRVEVAVRRPESEQDSATLLAFFPASKIITR